MIKITNHDGTRELQLDRAPVNALNPALTEALTAEITKAEKEARALVISGQPGMFSAGLDVPELLQLDRDGMKSFFRSFFRLLESIARSEIPVAAAITGHSPAGGAVVSLFCDYRVMSRGEFVFGLNETQVGLPVPEVIQYALIRLVGRHRAERQIVSGALVSPSQALDKGMVDALADDPETTVKAAIDWCNSLVALPGFAMLRNRAMLRSDLATRFDALGEQQVEDFVDGWFNTETQAVMQALVAKLKARA
ncbi:MAG: enoyl-CoA hydratase/isomerase family protein [Xanthomonadales bacterium]|nr:enoyl-CoA hydratase/isomerase family protein [Xanthomonadales bacterium]